VFLVQHIAVLISNWSDFEVMMLEKFGKDLTPHHGPERDMDRNPVFRFRDSKVAEHWVNVDLFSWFTQLGIIPPMGG